jgi:hypothetical protein
LKGGHVPKKSVMPTSETIAEPIATDRQASPGRPMPQNDRAATTKPSMATIQKAPAMGVAVAVGSAGSNHERRGLHPPVGSLGRSAIQMSAPSAPP